MEKANGEAAHASVIEVDSVRYVVVGSKNVHILVRVDNPEDIMLYEGPRFKFASEIASFFVDMLQKLDPPKQQVYLDKMLQEGLTAIFEYEDPNHCHIVPLYQRRLKFITFTQDGIRHESPTLDSLDGIINASVAAAAQVKSKSTYLLMHQK